jgi:hypothetical protein
MGTIETSTRSLLTLALGITGLAAHTPHLAELSILRPGPPRNCEGLKNHGGRRFPFCAGAVKRRPRGHCQPVFLLAKNCQDRSDSHLGQPPGGLAGQWFETASQNGLADHLVFT